MADPHPEVLALIAAGPRTRRQDFAEVGVMGATVYKQETPEEFARRIALRAVELEREECAKVCERVYLDASPHASIHVMQTAILAIRRRGKP